MYHAFIFANKVFDLSLGESLTSEGMIGNIDEILEKTESCVCKELEISLIVSNNVIIVFFETAVSFASQIVLTNNMTFIRIKTNIHPHFLLYRHA